MVPVEEQMIPQAQVPISPINARLIKAKKTRESSIPASIDTTPSSSIFEINHLF